ncbi:hypothetical protein GGI23_005250 [Coemansia sp. RSA 2559]|nr:hypothetical protein GGI23_005250 [Coemansia sp. RSA 2559]
MSIMDIASPSDQQQIPASLRERSTAPLQAEMPLVTPAPISSALATPQPTDRRAPHRRSSAPKDGTYAGGSSSGRTKREQQTHTATDIAEIAVGNAEEIPSIGKFDMPRTLYAFKERVREFELTHGSQWREKMDSRRRQNWSRISAVYNRIIQLRGPSTAPADVERAIAQIEREMAENKVTLTRYSQLVRKQLNNERRQSIHHGDGSRTLKLEGEI